MTTTSANEAVHPTGSGSFDEDHPPSRELIDDCVHCGFCLATCPTFVVMGEEMDSPRGRIYLMRAALDGAPLDERVVTHFDRCLGCMACVTACPSRVQYDRLIEATRAQVERNFERSIGERAKRALVFALFPYPRRLRVVRALLRAYQRLGLRRFVHRTGLLSVAPPFVRTMEEIAPPITDEQPVASVVEADGPVRGTVGLLTGCVQGSFFPQVNAATVRVLAAEGYRVVAPTSQGCCGALSAHAGRRREAERFARAVIDTFERQGVERIIVNSAGCGSQMKEYGDLLAGDRAYAQRASRFAGMVCDIAEFLATIEPRATRHPLSLRVAYHDACHLAHAQGIREEPRRLLAQVPGLSVSEIAEGEICCGSAGVYNLFQPANARVLGDRKAERVARTGAELLVAANPGCTMQIASALARRGTHLPTGHTIELLDASIRGESADSLVARLDRLASH